MTGGMMGRTSDTRIYNPRSESSEMFRANHEDESAPSGIEDDLDKEQRADKRQAKKEKEAEEDKSIKHIKVRGHHLGIKGKMPEDVDEEEEKFKPRGSVDNPSDQTMPSGAGGFLTSLATGAKGPGAAGGEMIQMSEPMRMANQLLKQEEITPYDKPPFAHGVAPLENISCPHCKNKLEGTYRELHTDDPLVELFCRTCDIYDDGSVSSYDNSSLKLNPPNPDDTTLEAMIENDPTYVREDLRRGDPMDIAWQLLKVDRGLARRRKKEGYAKWAPSTGAFEKPVGGFSGKPRTGARAKIISRNLPMGRKTGLMRPHLSVEMSHRGIASKQPMSKDPQQYRPYLASQQARKLLGNVKTPYTPHLAHSQRSFNAGKFGGGRPTGMAGSPRVPRPRLHQVRAPSIVPPKMKMPHLNRPKMPSMVTMSEDPIPSTDILKANWQDETILRIMAKEIRELMRLKKDKDSKKKGKGNPDVAGAASTLPNYAGNNPVSTTKNEGGTEDENDARRWGMSPLDLAGRGSGRV